MWFYGMFLFYLKAIIKHFLNWFYGILLRLVLNIGIRSEVWELKKMDDGDKCDWILIESIYFYVRQDLTTSTAR